MAKRLLVAVLAAAALLLALYASPAHAQSTSVTRSKLEKKEETGVIVIEGELIKAGTFIFRGNTVTYRHENRTAYPRVLKLDGKRIFKETPFELGFKPVLSKAAILEQECGGKVELERSGDTLLLRLDQRKVRDEGRFRIVLSLADPEQGVEAIEKPPKTAETGKKKLPSKMDLVKIEKEKTLNSYWLFMLVSPRSSIYPTRKLIRLKLSIPKTIWTIEDEEYFEDSFRKDAPWVVQPTDEQVRARRELDSILFGF